MSEIETTSGRIKLLATLFRAMGNFVVTIGKEEKEIGELEFFKKFTTDSLGLIAEFAEYLTSEELGILMNLLLKLTNHVENLSNLFQISPEQKLIVGQDLIKLSSDSIDLMNRINERISSK